MNEKDLLNNIIIKKTITNLEKHFFKVIFVNNKNDVLNELEKLIDKNAVIGYGGSRTLEEIGFFEKFNKKDYPNILDRINPDNTPDVKAALQAKALTSDFFISSANAISATGEIILIDKWGNRSAAVTFGPKKRIIISGINKIEEDLNSALKRAQNKASVLNNIRFETKNPCTITGYCQNCESENRLCSATTIIHRAQPKDSIIIFLVNEDLGF